MKSQRGNILFIILLAVILFAALSYAVVMSMRGGGKNASSESLQTIIASLQNAQMESRQALQRMMLVNDLKDWQINYAKTGTTIPILVTNSTCTNDACDLFSPNGGGVNGFMLPPKYQQSVMDCPGIANYAGRPSYTAVGIKGVGMDDNTDLLMAYRCVTTDLCLAVNDAMGVVNPGGIPPVDAANNNNAQALYSGPLSSTSIPLVVSPDEFGIVEPSMAGKQMFCTRHNTNQNSIWLVLIER